MHFPPLPEYFHLPTRASYDEITQNIDEDVEFHGSPASFLGAVRANRRFSHTFSNDVLAPMAKTALCVEEIDEEGQLRDRSHLVANAAMSGLIFGHVMNEAWYPFLTAHRPYNKLFINRELMSDEEREAFDHLGGHHTPAGRRLGFWAMASNELSDFSESAAYRVHAWSKGLIPSEPNRQFFIMGVGLALYAAWDVYGDQAIAEGKAQQVGLAIVPADRGPETL